MFFAFEPLPGFMVIVLYVPGLSSAEEQNHKFEKQRLSELCEASVALFTDRSVPGCKKLHKESNAWFA